MGRKPLSQEQQALRDAERAEMLATRRTRTPKTNTSQSTVNMEVKQDQNQEQNQNQPDTTGQGQNNTAPSTEPAAGSVAQTVSTEPPVKEEPKTSSSTNPSVEHQPDSTFSMLGQNKVKRGYSQPVINENLRDTVIPEPNITTDPLSQAKAQEIMKGAGGNQPGSAPIIPAVEGFAALPLQEQQLAAEQTTELIMGAYDRLHWLGRKYVSVDMDDLADDHRRGELNMNFEAFEDDDDPEGGITIKEYFEDFNAQVEDEFVVKQEFKDAVRPRLERVCLKRGWGASDEVFLMFKFGEDLAMKAGMLVGFKKLTNKYMQEFKDDHTKIKARVAAERKRQIDQEKREEERTAAIIKKQDDDTKKAETPAAINENADLQKH